jgi:transcriptional regulator with XRE-family HTH domain
MLAMISTGLTYLDKLTGGLNLGDNVVWEAADGVPVEYFIRSFFDRAKDFSDTIIYINFNFSPHTILKRYDYLFKKKNSILIDAFTHGKGNSDRVFLDFYSSDLYDRERMICIENPKNITSFVSILNEIEMKHKEGSFYIFDGVTGMNELWKDETAVLDFFTFTCPKLYDLNALAYWVLSREAHSREFIAGIMHITQIVFAINGTDSEYYELKVHKLQDRTPLYGAQPSFFKIIDQNILFEDKKVSDHIRIGEKVKNLRKEARITQAELASSLSMTPGAVSQIENDIITPSLQTLVQLSAVFGKPVDYFLGLFDVNRNGKGFYVSKKTGYLPVPYRNAEMLRMLETEHYGMKPYMVTLVGDKAIEGPIVMHKGKEYIVVIMGSLTLTIDNETVVLEEEDSILLTDSFVSKWQNSDDSECKFLYLLF